jgi:hypothetical protein
VSYCRNCPIAEAATTIAPAVVAKTLGISESHLQRVIESGALPARGEDGRILAADSVLYLEQVKTLRADEPAWRNGPRAETEDLLLDLM